MRSRTVVGLFLVMGLVGLAGSPTLAADKQITLTWTAGGLGGGWYTIAGGLADLIHSVHNDIVIKVIPGGGTVNPALVNKKEADLGGVFLS